jgi:ubiquinone/menaquinone biosynthesis C-methylase UbiE
MVQQRQRDILKLLRQEGIGPLADQRVLEVGCGYGGVLHEFLGFGLSPHLVHGAELLKDRVGGAHSRLPQLSFTQADGQRLPYAANRFDIVFQYTVFSSILDDGIKTRIAQEMQRVVKKPGGLIIWYDFWLNPSNRQTRGIRPAEIRQLFPDCRLTFHRITLAPPLARKLVPMSWIGCALLEKMRVFNTHFLVAIHPSMP